MTLYYGCNLRSNPPRLPSPSATYVDVRFFEGSQGWQVCIPGWHGRKLFGPAFKKERHAAYAAILIRKRLNMPPSSNRVDEADLGYPAEKAVEIRREIEAAVEKLLAGRRDLKPLETA
jgi:hypothetical protein